jgi:uncharacterized protein (TIGR02679 family)
LTEAGRPVLDVARARRVLGDPDLTWLVERIRARLERGEALEGVVTRTGVTFAERRAVALLLGRPAGRGESLTVRLSDVARALIDAGISPDLRTAVEALTAQIEDRSRLRVAELAARARALQTAACGRHASEPWYRTWLDDLERDGTVTRLVRRDQIQLLDAAVHVLESVRDVSADSPTYVPLPVFAEATTGDTKALSGTPLATLVLRALALRVGAERPVTAEDRRRLWEGAGVVAGDLSSQVLVVNLRVRPVSPAGPTLLSHWLNGAAEQAIPFRITLQQLVALPVVPLCTTLFVCENPAVLRAAAEPLPVPLVCTEGQPSIACDRLLRSAAAVGTRILWRNDFDWDGVRMTAAALTRYAAEPWRMGVDDYCAALEGGDSEPLKGVAAIASWDAALSAAMAQEGRAIMEERLIPRLLEDLRRGCPP